MNNRGLLQDQKNLELLHFVQNRASISELARQIGMSNRRARLRCGET